MAKDFLAKNNATSLEIPPYSPELDLTDVYPFPRLNSASKRRRSCDATDMFKNAKEEMKRLFTKWLPEIFPASLQMLAEMCSCSRGLF